MKRATGNREQGIGNRAGGAGGPSPTWAAKLPSFVRRGLRGGALWPVFLFAALLLAPPVASGQVATGLPQFASFGGGPFDTVDEANGNVSFAVPVVKKAGRGMPFTYSLAYNGSMWVPYNSSGTSVWTPVPNGGWGSAGSATTGSVTYSVTQAGCEYPSGPGGTMYYWNVYVFDYYYDPNGTQHTINKNVSSWTSSIPCSNGASFPNSASGTLTDGSGYSYTVNSGPGAWIYPPSGLTISVPVGGQTQGSVTDTNGNSVSFSTSSGTTTFTDTLGLTALTVSGSGTPSSPIEYTYTDDVGQVFVQVNYSPYTVRTNFGCSGITDYGPTQAYLVSSIALPDNTSYSFTYEATSGYSGDVTGRLASVTLPTGGTISYSYLGSNNGILCRDGTPPTLERTTPDSSPNYWKYARTETALTQGMSWTTAVTDPDSNQTTVNFWADYAGDAYLTERQVAGLATLVTCYNNNPNPCTSSSNSTAISLPITQRSVTTTLGSMESETDTYYNSYGFVTKVDEYDFGSGGVGTFKRETMACPYSFSNTYIQDRPQYKLVYSATGNASNCSGTSGLVAETTYGYDNNGNLTSESHTNTTGSPSSISRSFTYNSNGTLNTATDFNSSSHITSYTYASGSASCYGSFPTTINPPISSLAVTETWNCYGGVVTSVTDPNGQTTYYTYNDPFWRLTETQYPDGGQTNISYTDSSSGFSVETSRLLSGSTCTGTNCHQITQSLDGLGRVISAVDGQACNGAGSTVTTSYDSLGRVYKVSNPYCTKSDPSYGLTVYGYDALSRVNSITYPDTAAASIGYSGNCSTTQDPAGNQRTLCRDALGRLTAVTEDPGTSPHLNYQTTYTYDDLNDLMGVAQGSSQTRAYRYDMLGRLSSAKVPEVNAGGTQCPATYGYDANGNLTSKTAPLENQTSCSSTVTTTYAYDALNRLTSKTYNDTPATPPASYFYDQAPSSWPAWSGVSFSNAKGRLVLACTNSAAGTCSSPASATAYSYDPVGRIANFWQCNPSNCPSSSIWNTQYSYDLAGDVNWWSFPGYTGSTVTLTNTVNSAQQVTAVQSSWQDSTHPQYLAQSIAYTPWGAVTQLENGCAGSGCTNTQETYTYNNRLQPWMIQLGTSSSSSADYCLVYNYFSSWTPPSSCPTPSSVPASGSGNNGNVMGYWYQDSVESGFSHTATYGYDAVNRLISAVATGNSTYNLTFGYTGDGSNGQYGNMACVQNGNTNGPCPQWSYSASTNQLSSSTGCTYDAAGNLTKDCSTAAGHTYQWDAEGRVAVVDPGPSPTWTFTYNAVGDRVQWAYSGGADQHLFDPVGNWLGNAGEYSAVWRGNVALAVYIWGDTLFNHANLLGSTTLRTNQAGTAVEDTLFYPWGQNTWKLSGSGGYNFAGMPYYDTTTNTDLTEFRLYSPGLGRWLSPDPMAGDITNPQSLNRYPYVLNNPTTLTDPLGLQGCPPGTTQGPGPQQCSANALAMTQEQMNWGVMFAWDEFELLDLAVKQTAWGLAMPRNAEGGVNMNQLQDYMQGILFPIFGNLSALGLVGLTDMIDRANAGTRGTVVRIDVTTALGHCLSQAAAKNGVSLALDAAGFIPGESTAASIAQVGVGVASTVNSIATGDTTGSVLGGAGTGVSVLVPIAKRAGWGIATALPVAGQVLNGLGTIKDLKSFNTDVQSCLAGQ